MTDRVKVDLGNGTELVTPTWNFKRLLDAAEIGMREQRLENDMAVESFINRCRSICMPLRTQENNR